MKKKVFLVLVLALFVAGGVFADNVPYTFDNGGISGLTITAAETRSSMRSLSVTYSVDSAESLGVVTFRIIAVYSDPPANTPQMYRTNDGNAIHHVDTNREMILRKQTSGTWTWTLPRDVFFNLVRIEIAASK